MQANNWDPREAGKLANARDQVNAQQQEQQRIAEQNRRAIESNRRQRSHSVVRPAMHPIKRESQQLCATFNSMLNSPHPQNKAQVYEDMGGMGLHNIPSAFAVIRHSSRVELIPDYEKWQIVMTLDNTVRKVYEVCEEVINGQVVVYYKEGRDRVTAEHIASSACQLVCK